MKKRRIAVMGGGHGARTVAADMTLAGHEVRLFEMERLHENVAAIFERKEIAITGKARNGKAKLALATHDAKEAIRGTDAILIVVPSLYHGAYADLLAEHLEDGQNVVLIRGRWGALSSSRGFDRRDAGRRSPCRSWTRCRMRRG